MNTHVGLKLLLRGETTAALSYLRAAGRTAPSRLVALPMRVLARRLAARTLRRWPVRPSRSAVVT